VSVGVALVGGLTHNAKTQHRTRALRKKRTPTKASKVSGGVGGFSTTSTHLDIKFYTVSGQAVGTVRGNF
jgi:hypothetical protein